MTDKRLSNCRVLHIHNVFTDKLDVQAVAKNFVSYEHKKYFGNFIFAGK